MLQQRKQQLLPVDHPHSHRAVLLLRRLLGRQLLRLRLRQQLRVRRQLRRLLLRVTNGRNGAAAPRFPGPAVGRAQHRRMERRAPLSMGAPVCSYPRLRSCRTWTRNSGSFIIRPARRGSLHSR